MGEIVSDAGSQAVRRSAQTVEGASLIGLIELVCGGGAVERSGARSDATGPAGGGGGPGRGVGIRLGEGDLGALSRARPADLERRLDLDLASAERLAAAFELGRRVERSRLDPRASVADPEAAFQLLSTECRGLDRETFQVLLLDGRHRLIRRHCVAVGTLTTSLVHPREVFGPAVREGAAAVLVAHNHPSGDPEPSSEDREVTRRLLDVGRLLGVPLLDHLVLGDGRYVSLRRRMGF
ncbi:JAB domain-containing protein [Engelhardtia mirabilis]|uniref:JAB domain-containing protein n=1 Tax=Engelhardtia mirabilis TaxID=2528011 RepID=UPI003AF3CE46